MPPGPEHAPATATNQNAGTDVISLCNAQTIVEMLLPAVTQRPGLTGSLQRFARQNDGPAGRFAQALFDGLTHGQSFEQAIRHAQPSLPRVLQELLILGCGRGVLDLVLSDLLKSFQALPPEHDPRPQMTELLAQWQSRTANALICAGCLQREITHILRRAELEEAQEVILQQ